MSATGKGDNDNNNQYIGRDTIGQVLMNSRSGRDIFCLCNT